MSNGWGNPKIHDFANDYTEINAGWEPDPVAIMYRDSCVGALHFLGPYDAHAKYQPGDIVILDNGEHIWNGKEFEPLAALSSFVDTTEKLREYKPEKNCRNCGASLFIRGRCAYCGTER